MIDMSETSILNVEYEKLFWQGSLFVRTLVINRTLTLFWLNTLSLNMLLRKRDGSFGTFFHVLNKYCLVSNL